MEYIGKKYLRHKFQSRLRKLIKFGVDRKKSFWLCTQPGLYQVITTRLFKLEKEKAKGILLKMVQ